MIKARFSILLDADDKIREMNERIDIAEKYLGEMCAVFAAFTRKLARLRDKHDDIAKVFKDYCNEEKLRGTLSISLGRLSKAMTILADYLDIEVHRIELKVVNVLSQYGPICKTTRDHLQAAVSLRDKQIIREKHLSSMKTKFGTTTSATNSDLLKAKLEVNKVNKNIDELIENFEKSNLTEVKALLLDFIAILLKQHTKTIDILTAAYYDISAINVQNDIQQFKNKMKSTEKSQQRKLDNRHSKSADDLDQIHPVSISMKQEKMRNAVNNNVLRTMKHAETLVYYDDVSLDDNTASSQSKSTLGKSSEENDQNVESSEDTESMKQQN